MVLSPTHFSRSCSGHGRLEQEDRLVFQHFPKTGGTTVHNCLTPLFDPSEICPERLDRYSLWPSSLLARYKLFSSHSTARQLQYIPNPVKTISFFRNPIERCISLYYYWRSISISDEVSNQVLEPRFTRSHSPREFFELTDIEQCRPFWNIYASGLAGDALFSPEGHLWRSDDELLEEALAGLEHLAFVGISEDMSASMDALCRQLDIPNLYVGQLDNVTTREDTFECNDNTGYIDEETLALIKQANSLDMIVYDRALTIALGDRKRDRVIRCSPGQMPACYVRKRYAKTWVENRAGGHILFGPYARLLPGRYAATFRLRPRPCESEKWSGAAFGHLDVVARRGSLVLAHQELDDLSVCAGEVSQQLTFDVNHVLSDAEFRVWASPGAPFDVEVEVSLHQV